MKCPYCGAENDDDAYVCTSCGMPLKRSHPHHDETEINDENDFFESDMYEGDEPQETNNETADDESVAAGADTIFYQKENIDEADEEGQTHGENFSFDEDDEEEEPYEDVIPQESKFDQLKNKFKSMTEKKSEPAYEEDEEDDYDEEPAPRAGGRVRSFFEDDDEEDVETDQAREDNLEDVYDYEERSHKKPSFRIIPFKVLILILVVASVAGGILMMRNKSANTNTTTTKTKTTTTVKPEIASVKASSALAETGYDHSAALMIDGDLTTAWQEGVKGDGLGENATFTLKKTASVKSCSIANGYDKSSYLYRRNNRVKEATFTFDDGTSETHTLKDVFNTYTNITFNKAHKTKTIKITITSIYRGTYYHDTCISEVKFA